MFFFIIKVFQISLGGLELWQVVVIVVAALLVLLVITTLAVW